MPKKFQSVHSRQKGMALGHRTKSEDGIDVATWHYTNRGIMLDGLMVLRRIWALLHVLLSGLPVIEG